MNRILVIGCGGAGKTTLSKQLGAITGLPVIHLDAYFWKPGWVAADSNHWRDCVAEITERDRWIMDGNYGGTFDLRFAAADTIIFLDTPTWRCLWNVFKRRLAYRGTNRSELPIGCNERLTVSFIWWILTYRRQKRPGILTRLLELNTNKRIEICQTTEQISAFLFSIYRAQTTHQE